MPMDLWIESLLPTGFPGPSGGSMDNLPVAHSPQEGHVGTYHCKGVVKQAYA